jgi:hypothetical protein
LTVDDGGASVDSDTVTIDVVACPADPICDTALEAQAVDVNIAIEQAGKYLYKSQLANGSWAAAGGPYTCATTGYAIWAWANQGHLATNDFNTDIYAEYVQRGVDFILANATSQAVIAQPNIGSPDGNGNGLIYSMCGTSGQFVVGYANPIATTGILAAYSAAGAAANPVPPASLPGQPAGYTYFDLVHDSVDWTAYAQEDSLVPSNRGGWRYAANFGSSDVSVDSWHCVLMEGFEQVFGGTVIPAVKTEVEHRIDGAQCDAGAQVGLFGYGAGCGAIDTVSGGFNGRATTPGGLSCLVAVNTGGYSPTLLDGGALSNAVFPDTTTRRADAVTHIGRAWSYPSGLAPVTAFLDGNRSNPYSMWTTCRALRLNGTTTLVNGAVSFDWETGESPPGSGVVLPPADINEGYFPYLVRTQDPDGTWRENTWGDYNDNFEAALNLLCLLPTVFGPPEPECPDDPEPRTQGFWHRQCLGLSSNDPVCEGIDPGRNGRGPQSPTVENFCPDLYDCADDRLNDLGLFVGADPCDGMDADPPSDKCEKAKKQTTALVFNVCWGELEDGCEIDVSAEGCSSTNVGDLLTELAGLINDGIDNNDPASCNQAAACADAVNNGFALTGGGLTSTVPVESDGSSVRETGESRGKAGARR